MTQASRAINFQGFVLPQDTLILWSMLEESRVSSCPRGPILGKQRTQFREDSVGEDGLPSGKS